MYENECKLKRHLSQNIAFETNRDTVVFYNVAWLQEPYIDTNADLLLESMLVETGLRWRSHCVLCLHCISLLIFILIINVE